jgi:hypothetical protein
MGFAERSPFSLTDPLRRSTEGAGQWVSVGAVLRFAGAGAPLTPTSCGLVATSRDGEGR